MPLTLDKVHNYVHEEETNRMILQSKSPYKRFVKEGETPVIVQGGRFYSDGGEVIPSKEVPTFVWAILRRTTKEGLESLGITEDSLYTSKDDKPEDSAPKTGTTPEKVDDERPKTLQEVILSLSHDDDSHWTKGGLPDLNNIKEQFGKYRSRQQVTDAVPDYVRKE
jgi:hypothetical protein